MNSYILLDIVFIAVTLAQVLRAEETQTVNSRVASAFAHISNDDLLTSLESNPVLFSPVTAVQRREERVKCLWETDPETPIRNGTEIELCCEEIVRSFRFEWTLVLVQLSDYLRILSRFKCSQFEDECQRRPYGFSTFNHMTYERFCNESKFLDQCQNQISEVLTRHNDQSLPDAKKTFNDDTSEKDILRDIKKINLTLNDLLDPCVQASLIDIHTRPKDGFFELKIITGPCRIIWCGFPGYAYESYEISEWTCMPQRCRANVIILMVTCGILAVASTTTNALSLFVFAKHRKLRDSQGIYKMSLATSDLLVGLFVFATAIETMRRSYIPTITLNHPSENGLEYPMLEIHSFTREYRNFVGFFTTLSTSTSIYTLMVASFDRFMVVFRPLRYNLYTAKFYATKLSIVVWVMGCLFAILPIIVVPVLEFQFLAGFIETITADGVEGVILLTIAFFLPIVLMIVSHVATIIFSKKNAKARPRHIPPGAKIREMSVENRLAKTLSIMIGVFLLCLVPLSVLIGLHFFLEGVNTYKPDELDRDRLALLNTLEPIFAIVFLSNSLWNFFIYNARSKGFRRSCIKLFLRTKQKLRSKLLRDSAKEARQRRTSAAISNSSQVQCNTASTI